MRRSFLNIILVGTGIEMALMTCSFRRNAIQAVYAFNTGVPFTASHHRVTGTRQLFTGITPHSFQKTRDLIAENKASFYYGLISRISMSSKGDSDENESMDEDKSTDFEPTWTYVPYKPRPLPRAKRKTNNFQSRPYSAKADNWDVPKTINIPQDRVELSFVRASGAGGQNVNKVSTKVELRFHVKTATWIPMEVRDRLLENEANRVNKEGIMTLNSQEFRTQNQNKKDVFDKLEAMILKAYPRPKVRKIRKGLSKATKERRKEQKRSRSEVKKNRGKVDF